MIKYEQYETETTPYVSLDADTGELLFKGRSIPENVTEFFRPIMHWIDSYAQNPLPQTTAHLQFEYFNTSSSKRIFDILKQLETIQLSDSHTKVNINWYYEEGDEDIYFAGTDYRALLDKQIEFNLLPMRTMHPEDEEDE